MSEFKGLENVMEVLNYQFLGITLKEPLLFCIRAAVIFIFIKFVIWVIRKLYLRNQRRSGRRRMDETNAKFLTRIAITTAYIIGVASVLSMIPALKQIGTSILASAGIMAMAIGLASQEALSNFVGGIFIIVGRPFKIGDFIEIDTGVAGTVTEITLRHTVIRNAENRMIIVPNSTINTSIITNSNIGDSATCAFIEVGVAYSEDLDRCISVMREVVEAHPLLIDRRTNAEKETGVDKVKVRVNMLGDFSITLRAFAWGNTPGDASTIKFDSLKAIKERFDKEGIEIPYPYYNQIVRTQK